MQTTVELDGFDFDFSDAQFTNDTRATRDAQEIVTQASNNGFYSIPAVLLPNLCNSFEHMTRLGDEDDKLRADIASKALLKEKELLIKQQFNAAQKSEAADPNLRGQLITNHNYFGGLYTFQNMFFHKFEVFHTTRAKITKLSLQLDLKPTFARMLDTACNYIAFAVPGMQHVFVALTTFYASNLGCLQLCEVDLQNIYILAESAG
ncbi:hypothetical protein B0H14DRAFT_2609278 [Mycena olivaceomarginata]|nr:hypothetical protein B0H14DRAFT_2609278 [Mycena olivaceomarginata]